ncbi:Translation initiation factor IF-3,translation initiation factor IF-3,Translation initiation factor 3 (IF-3),translation initiation factor IF-3,Translation initiation factor IF-3, N-terminal domain [Chlamydia serpentis]|uniref:Translation initiation factor IF-3 n=1 Tax=Chlamydia serpentis TaxID=1967782 RepID=A0A2R8FCE6_9CHLA|nr:translation initiation factor IF-3 [Chlamydia serpentis]SPN74095.1 Translation initiation factor IF-3,translation initiation factor IF-3,Translation initiation factor 3 (IF-3),translation initiation factor IF-3,Translation initiation factor IF-3, N-terminal domain [Chlamydia serpentis]
MALNFKINRQIRAPKVRLIGSAGEQLGILAIKDALDLAREAGLDLVEVASNSEPPVCKIMDYGKYRYDLTKKEKDSKKAQHQVRIKEVKLKPNIDENDFLTKLKQARTFVEKGNKVKITCMFRGRELAYPEHGFKIVQKMSQGLEDIGFVEAEPKLAGRSLICVVAPGAVKTKKKQEKSYAQDEK